MFSQQRPGPQDATTSTGIGRNASPSVIRAPVPRRATNGSVLISDSSSDSEQYYSRQPLPNTPLQSSTPSALNQQLLLNGIPDTRNGSSAGAHSHIPHTSHARTNSGSSATSNLSTSSRKAARFSPNLTIRPPDHLHNPPPPGATPIRSAMRQTPPPAGNFPQSRYPAHGPNVYSVPNISIVHPTPPSPTSPVRPPNWQTNARGNSRRDSDEDSTPGQRAYRSPAPSSRGNRSPPVQGHSPSDQFNDSGYFSPHPSLLTKNRRTRLSTIEYQQQPQGASSTSPHWNQAIGTMATNQSQPTPSQVNQQQPSGPRIRTSWQAPRPPHASSPVIPGLSRSSSNASRNSTNLVFTPDPVRPSHAVHTPARSAHRSTDRDPPRISTSFGHPVGAPFSAHPRSSHTRSPQHTPYGPARAVLTPANENGNGNLDVNSVVSDLFRVPPTSVAWQTPRGVLSWTPHPGLPDSGANLLGGGRGSGNGSGGGVGNADWLTGGYPMPGACPTWTPGAWPPTSASATSRRAMMQLAPWMIPNPCNAGLPHMMWDISQLPTTAKRITGNHVIVDVTEKLEDIATHPAVDRLVVVCQVGVAQQFWGHIDVKASRPKGVTVWDVFNGMFEYFQKRVGRRELDRMKQMLGDEQLEEKMASAFYQRVHITPALPDYERKQGLKRVDCLGDACFFWGLYVSYNDDDTWQLNLGLVNRRRYG